MFINFSLLFRNSNYGWLYLGQFISFFGTMITGVALPYQIYHLTHSTLLVGLIGICQLVPMLFTALIGGALSDRYHRRLLLLITESLLSIGCLWLAYNSAFNTHIWVIFLVAGLMAGINGLHRPALDSVVQQIVAKPDFPTVGALANLKFAVGSIAGPAVAGLIIAYYGIVVTYLIDFATFIVSLIALLMMSHIPKPKVEKDESTFSAIKSGIQYAFSRQELLGSYAVDIVAMIFGMPMALFPAIAEYYGDAKALGMLYAAPAVGALIISFMSGWTKKIKRYGVAIAYSASLWGIAIIFFGLAHQLWLALFFLALAGAFDSLSGIFRMTLWNETIPNNLRGRLSGIEMISYMGGPKIGDAEAGLVAAAFGVTASVVSGGVLCIIGVAVCCYYLPKFWEFKSS